MEEKKLIFFASPGLAFSLKDHSHNPATFFRINRKFLIIIDPISIMAAWPALKDKSKWKLD